MSELSGTQTVAEAAAEVERLQANAYDDDGVDLTLIAWMLGLSPSERLDVLQDAIDFFAPLQPE